MPRSRYGEVKRGVARRSLKASTWAEEKIPPGLRSLLGVVLSVGGIVGFLPVVGFWMLPIGVMLVATDVPPLRRRFRAWLEKVVAREEAKRQEAKPR